MWALQKEQDWLCRMEKDLEGSAMKHLRYGGVDVLMYSLKLTINLKNGTV